MDEEDAEIVKLLGGDRLLASHTRAYDRCDIEAVQSVDKLFEKHQATRHTARTRKKWRKAELRNYVTQLECDRVTDLPSTSERS